MRIIILSLSYCFVATIMTIFIFVILVTDLKQIKEYYSNRVDKLKERVHNHRTGWIVEFYKPGRHRCLKGKRVLQV